MTRERERMVLWLTNRVLIGTLLMALLLSLLPFAVVAIGKAVHYWPQTQPAKPIRVQAYYPTADDVARPGGASWCEWCAASGDTSDETPRARCRSGTSEPLWWCGAAWH